MSACVAQKRTNKTAAVVNQKHNFKHRYLKRCLTSCQLDGLCTHWIKKERDDSSNIHKLHKIALSPNVKCSEKFHFTKEMNKKISPISQS